MSTDYYSAEEELNCRIKLPVVGHLLFCRYLLTRVPVPFTASFMSYSFMDHEKANLSSERFQNFQNVSIPYWKVAKSLQRERETSPLIPANNLAVKTII